ncbi:E3 ubiquitin-protein ligase PUB24-like [Carica papaya]|uniref:E3 ubiquitin-protein ligase PUB24-like n=1 Tax=Carica papaya TaxID=3649 RepID=UPI000B8CB393|nr:E3 ubiquitin-protein ligase PUB24-like [Carica papaya]
MEVDIQIPQFFICPISLQIMRDPVTTVTGITYDRESIEKWLLTAGENPLCPVTNQPLAKDSDLTPNHTLRRLIQSWCADNASYGVDRIPTPKPPLDKFRVMKMMRDLDHPHLKTQVLMQLEILATDNDRNRKYMVEAGLPKAMLMFLTTCFNKRKIDRGLEEALNILRLIRTPSSELLENNQMIESLTWVLGYDEENQNQTFMVKSYAGMILKTIIKTANSHFLERLKPEFFQTLVGVLRTARKNNVSYQVGNINTVLNILLNVCSWGRNRVMMVQSGAVFELVEMELDSPLDRETTELILGILFHLCSCAEGRAEFLSHSGGIAVVSKRIMKVSETADYRAVLILSLIGKASSGSSIVIGEMLRVGAVSKLFMILQGDSAGYLKKKAREILRLHSDEWKKSPCFDASLLIRCGVSTR